MDVAPKAGEEMDAGGNFEQENRGDDFGGPVNERQGGDGQNGNPKPE